MRVGIEEHDRIHRLERPRLPRRHLGHHRIGDGADQIGRHLDAVHLAEERLNLAAGEAAGVQRDHFIVESGEASLVLPIKRRPEVAWRRPRLAAWHLSPVSRAKLREIDLHFHDLRHEAGSRLLENGWSIHHVKEMLGHAKISQTDTYLNAGKMGLHDSMKRFAPARRNPVAIETTTDQPLTSDETTTETPKQFVN